MAEERVEFVDADPSAVAGDDLVTAGGDGGPGGRRGPVLLVGLVVGALVVAFLVARISAGDAPPQPSATSAAPIGRPVSTPVTTPTFGLVGLPRAITEPRLLVAARSGDVVWLLDRGAGIVRIEGGVRTAVQLLERQATAMAVSPAGDKLYVATAGDQPSLQVLNATTLGLGRSRPLDGSAQALVVSSDAVWAAVGANLLRLDLDSLQTLDDLALPGVVLTDHLRVQNELDDGSHEYIAGLVTGADDDGTTTSRLLRVDPLSREVRFGPPIPGVVDVATSPLLTWVTAVGGSALTTRGYRSVLDTAPAAVATPPLPTGTRIYDGGGGFSAFLSVAPDSSLVDCHDPGGFTTSEIDVRPALPDAVITGQVLRTDTAFYVVTDRGLVRAGVGACA